MTLTEYTGLVQGSDEWLEARRGMLTASTIGQLITPKTVKPAANDYSRALIATLAAERITGWVDPVWVNSDMQRGQDDEPVARDYYAEHTGQTVKEVGFLVREFDNFKLGFSPDGLVGDDGLLEIKSRKPKKQVATVLSESGVPIENVAQVQAGLLVTGRAWCDFVSFADGMHLWVKRVLPDPRWRDAIHAACTDAEAAIERMVTDYHQRTDGLLLTERINREMEMTF